MAYQLKSTGIAANCTMFIGVDPDTSAIKDFASSAVTADMVIGANVTTGSQTWDGNTRSYFQLGAGTAAADFVQFGTNKPSFGLPASSQRTVVFIGEIGGDPDRVFGNDSSNYFASRSLSGGTSHPIMLLGGIARNGGLTNPASGKKIYGLSFVQGTSTTAYSAADTDASMTEVTGLGSMTSNAGYSLDYIGRRDDSTIHQTSKIHAVLIFNTALSNSDWASLRDDWFGTLLEVVSGGAVEGDLAATEAADAAAITGDVIITGTLAATEAADVADLNGGSTPNTGTLAGTESQDVAAATGTVRNPRLVIGPLKNNTGTLLANETGATVYVYQTSGAHVVTKTSQTSDGSAMMTVTDAALVSGTTYRYIVVLGSGAEGMDKLAAS